MLGNINPVNLRGLRQAAYVLRSLEEGTDSHNIVECFDGDVQLVDIWTSFLIHNGWVYKTEVDDGSIRYVVTDKGRDWVHRLDGIPADA